MSQRISPAMIARQLDIARQLSGLDLGMEVNCPGDGRARYRLTMDAGSRDLSRVLFGAGEAFDTLHAVVRVLSAMKDAGGRP